MLSLAHDTITTIIFDLGKVIVAFDHFEICRGLAAYSSFPPEKIFEKIFSSSLVEELDTGRISPETFYKKIQHELGLSISQDRFRDIWNAIFTLMPGIDILLQALARRYKLVCLSNTNEWHFAYCLQQFPVLALFSAYVLSCRVGACKPDTKIYQTALMTAGAEARQCLYIDDIIEFVQTASSLGIRSVQFISVAQLRAELAALGIL